jgi:hypothetical protein
MNKQFFLRDTLCNSVVNFWADLSGTSKKDIFIAILN